MHFEEYDDEPEVRNEESKQHQVQKAQTMQAEIKTPKKAEAEDADNEQDDDSEKKNESPFEHIDTKKPIEDIEFNHKAEDKEEKKQDEEDPFENPFD